MLKMMFEGWSWYFWTSGFGGNLMQCCRCLLHV